jgi:hypothetical protein
MGERPKSEISVLEDSPPGEVAVCPAFPAFPAFPFQPKKELILFPGVFGCRGSLLIDIDR